MYKYKIQIWNILFHLFCFANSDNCSTMAATDICFFPVFFHNSLSKLYKNLLWSVKSVL